VGAGASEAAVLAGEEVTVKARGHESCAPIL
jgi:hypothetical protein